MGPVLPLHPDYRLSFICIHVWLNATVSFKKKRKAKKREPGNDRATLIRLSKAIITEFQHHSV